MRQVKLQPGDYVFTDGMSEELYHAVARAFMNAGAGRGEYRDIRCPLDRGLDEFGWDKESMSLYHSRSANSIFNDSCRILVAEDEVLNASNSGKKDIDMQNWKPEEGKPARLMVRNAPVVVKAIDDKGENVAIQEEDGDIWIVGFESLSPPLTEEDVVVSEMAETIGYPNSLLALDICGKLYAAGYRKIEPYCAKKDMNDPKYWKDGDLVKCVYSATPLFSEGQTYRIISSNSGHGLIEYKESLGDVRGVRVDRTSSKFIWHSRPHR